MSSEYAGYKNSGKRPFKQLSNRIVVCRENNFKLLCFLGEFFRLKKIKKYFSILKQSQIISIEFYRFQY